MHLTCMDGQIELLSPASVDGIYQRFKIHHLKPWEAVIIDQ
jgi:hypothetical protein